MDLRNDLLSLDDVATKEVKVPAWKRTLTIREMGLQESLNLLTRSSDGKVELSATDIARVLAACIIDPETKEPIFQEEDIPKLAKKNRAALMFLYNEITGLSGSAEDAEKN